MAPFRQYFGRENQNWQITIHKARLKIPKLSFVAVSVGGSILLIGVVSLVNLAANKSLERIFGDLGFLGSFGVLELSIAEGIHGVNSKPFSSALGGLMSKFVVYEVGEIIWLRLRLKRL